MGGKMSRNKGQRAERQFISMLQAVVDWHYRGAELPAPELKRNLMQTQNGGYDVVGLEWAAIEVKHQETLSINSWWEQTIRQCGDNQIPILAYKQNRRSWRVMTIGALDGPGTIPSFQMQTPVDITIERFLDWFSRVIALQVGQESGGGR